MKTGLALADIRTLFLDTAPIIYYVENIAPHRQVMDRVVAHVMAGTHTFITSSITLAECLIHPLRRGDAALAESFRLALRAVRRPYLVDREACRFALQEGAPRYSTRNKQS